MTLGDLRTQFQSLLNRTDCLDDQATIFLVQAMQRIQREIRIPSMERLVVYQDPGALSSIPIPDDFIQPIDLLVMNDGSICGYEVGAMVPLQHMSFRQLQRVSNAGAPLAYARYQSSFQIRGPIPAGCEAHVYYYGEFSPFVSDTDENELTASSPDLVTYGALALAGDYFDIPKADAWEARYQQFLAQVSQMAADVEMNGGPMVVQSAYGAF